MVPSSLPVPLNMDAILGGITLTRRRKKLGDITNGDGVEGVYAATFSRVGAQQRNGSKLGMEVLISVSHSERPLHAEEFCTLGMEGYIGLDVRNILEIETLLACSLELVTVRKSSSTL